jgi:hypothetical protein
MTETLGRRAVHRDSSRANGATACAAQGTALIRPGDSARPGEPACWVNRGVSGGPGCVWATGVSGGCPADPACVRVMSGGPPGELRRAVYRDLSGCSAGGVSWSWGRFARVVPQGWPGFTWGVSWSWGRFAWFVPQGWPGFARGVPLELARVRSGACPWSWGGFARVAHPRPVADRLADLRGPVAGTWRGIAANLPGLTPGSPVIFPGFVSGLSRDRPGLVLGLPRDGPGIGSDLSWACPGIGPDRPRAYLGHPLLGPPPRFSPALPGSSRGIPDAFAAPPRWLPHACTAVSPESPRGLLAVFARPSHALLGRPSHALLGRPSHALLARASAPGEGGCDGRKRKRRELTDGQFPFALASLDGDQ